MVGLAGVHGVRVRHGPRGRGAENRETPAAGGSGIRDDLLGKTRGRGPLKEKKAEEEHRADCGRQGPWEPWSLGLEPWSLAGAEDGGREDEPGTPKTKNRFLVATLCDEV